MDNVDLCTTWHKKRWKTHIGLLWWWLVFTHFLLKLSFWKTTELNEVAIIRTKSGRTESRSNHFNFFEQPSLNTGSVLEGIKLPGLIASDIAGMMYQGKQLDVLWTEDH
jgi:hypothetical protein